MPFDWVQYLILARTLGSATAAEPSLRSAISRAYYAAYKIAEHYCEDKGIPIENNGKSHQDVWDAFLKKGGTTFTRVYDNGDRLRRKRVKADYRTHEVISQGMTQDSLKESYNILFYLGASPPPP
jgi:hypothetical protein